MATYNKKKKYRVFFVMFLCLILAGVGNLICSQKMLSVSEYDYTNPKVKKSLKVVQISDLHNAQFGKENKRLVKKIRDEKPDVIFMTGDMLNEYEKRTDIVEHLIRELRDTAPIYLSLGNHEVTFIGNQKKGGQLVEQLKAAGAVVLQQEYIDTEIAGQEVRIGGLYGYVLAREWKDGSEQRFMEKFQETDRFKILLSHVPEGLLLWKSMEHWNVDLVFSGHVHGGQARLPFVGGLYDPEEGYFPTYTKGMFTCGKGTLVLSAGLGSARGIPRINNLPEIVVCEIKN